ncbi:MAG: hypothetical protein Q9162_004461 [Coniocarpon cinnabarinum]
MSGVFRKFSLKPGHKNSRASESAGDHASTASTPSTATREMSPASSGKIESPNRASTASTTSSKHADSVVQQVGVERGDERKTSRGPEIMSKPRAAFSRIHMPGHSPSRSSTQLEAPKNREGEDMSKNQMRKHEKHHEKEEKTNWHDKQTEELHKRRDEQMKAANCTDPPEMREKYGWAPVNNYSGPWRESQLIRLTNLNNSSIGQSVIFRARIHNYRKMSSKLAFFIFRQQTETIQGVLQESDKITHFMVHWAEHIPVESIVDVKGTIQQPKAKEGEVTGAHIHGMEVMVEEMHIVSKLSEHIPFSVNEAEVSEQEANAEGSTRHHVSDRARQNARIIDLRTTTSQAIFRVQAGVCKFFREYLDGQGFIEIHSPKLQGAATESGASVFKVDYFGRPAFLAQSPQLAKQMSVAADFGKVYEIGAVFRAENSNTHRHLTEYTGLDLEMAIDEHYHETLRAVDHCLKHIFEGVYKNFRNEIDLIKRQYPHEDLIWAKETPVFKFADAISILNETGWKGEDGKPLPVNEDIGTRDEIQLGRVIKEKFGVDYYIIDKFPLSARPFYTMPDPDNGDTTNAFDVFVRGQEIISGGQRVHDADMLVERMKKAKMDPSSMAEYMQGFEWGAPPHAGAGVGLERIVMLILQLGDIRHASLVHRDPKSLPAAAPAPRLRHPEASTLHPPWEGHDRSFDKTTAHKDLQPLEKLIANYGDATNTSWLEERCVVWREPETGAAVGYTPHNGFAITTGNPLCHVNQYTKVMAGYLEYIKKETHLKPLWLLCGDAAQEVLGSRFDWRTFSVAAEQRMNLESGGNAMKSFSNGDIQRKIRHADKEGVKIKDIEMGTTPPKDFRDKIDARVHDWLGNRKGHQHVHLTEVLPWQDMAHRSYYYAVAADGTICALVIMAQLSVEHGWQVKFALDFPGAPNGAIEACIIHALKAVQARGEKSATFGGAASNDFKVGMNLKGPKVKLLQRAYTTIATDLKLTQKTEFREKLGAEEDPIYVCYPPKGLGPKGVQAILTFFED